jgi:hypothetical protein
MILIINDIPYVALKGLIRITHSRISVGILVFVGSSDEAEEAKGDAACFYGGAAVRAAGGDACAVELGGPADDWRGH